MSTVRIATRADEPELMRLSHLMHEENAILSFDEVAIREMYARAFDRKGGIIGVIGERDNLEAAIYLLISRWWYTQDNHLEELFNFVRPDCRRSDHAKNLIKFAKHCSDEIRIPLVIGVLTHSRVVEKVRLYRRVLGVPSGAFWVWGAQYSNRPDLKDNSNFWDTPFPTRNRVRQVQVA